VICASSVLLVVLNVTRTNPHFEWPSFAGAGHEDHSYPYFFADSDGSGAIEEGEAKYPNRYQSWTPRLLRAAYNYQFVAKDPGAYTHNPFYAMQLLHDSIADLAEAGSGVTAPGERPEE